MKFKLYYWYRHYLTISPEQLQIVVTSSAGPDFDKIRDLVLGEDARRRSFGELSSESLNVIRGKRNIRGSGSKIRRRSQSKTHDCSSVICWNCKEVRHFRNQCPNDKQVNIAEDFADENLLVCCADSIVDSWVMDFGVSFHATHNSETLQNLVIGDFGNVRLANNKTFDVTGIVT